MRDSISGANGQEKRRLFAPLSFWEKAGFPVNERRWMPHRGRQPVFLNGKPGAKHDTPSHWHSCSEAIAAAEKLLEQGETDIGIGLAVGQAAITAGMSPITVCDIDNAKDENGKIRPFACKLIEQAKKWKCFTEQSMSGHGYHLIVPGRTEHSWNKKREISGVPLLPVIKNGEQKLKKAEIQILGASNAYVALTGDCIEGCDVLPTDEARIKGTLAILEMAVPVKGAAEKIAAKASLHEDPIVFDENTLSEQAQKVLAKLKRVNPDLHEKVLSPAPDEDRSKHGFTVTLGLMNEGFTDQEIVTLVAARTPFAEKAWANRKTQKGAVEWYQKYHLARARQKREEDRKELLDLLGPVTPEMREEARKAYELYGPDGRKRGPEGDDEAGDDEAKLAENWNTRIEGGETLTTVKAVRWAIRDVLAQQSVAAIVSGPKMGKSSMALSIALHLTAGMPFAGHRVMQGAKVLYLALESGGSLRKQVAAFCQQHKLAAAPANFFFQDRKINFSEPDDVEGLRAWIKVNGITLLVVDTLIHVTAQLGGEENGAADMKRALEVLRTAAGSAGLLILHHGTKADPENARGSSVLPGDVDDLFVIREKKSKGGNKKDDKSEDDDELDDNELDDDETPTPVGPRRLRLVHKLHREGQAEPVPFFLNPLEVGKDDEGEPVTSVVVEIGNSLVPSHTIEAMIRDYLMRSENARPTKRQFEAELNRLSGKSRSTLQRMFKSVEATLGDIIPPSGVRKGK